MTEFGSQQRGNSRDASLDLRVSHIGHVVITIRAMPTFLQQMVNARKEFGIDKE
jgi:hypothetical protein